MKEEDIQKAFVKWLRVNDITYFAPCNENIWSGIVRQYVPSALASKVIGMINNKLDAMGRVKGVHDVQVFMRGHVICIEFKTEKGKQTQEQIEWMGKMESAGIGYYVCRSVDDAIKIIDLYS